jgi:hypothetical protein
VVEPTTARTVRIHAGQSEPVVTPVQRLGFFIAQGDSYRLRDRDLARPTRDD